MKRSLGISVFVLTLLLQVAIAEEPEKKWFEEGFVKNALQGRAAAMLNDTGFSREEINWHLCGAISSAQYKHSELFVSPQEDTLCYEDKDCGIGSLGGFCAVAAHKSQLEGYQLYVKSPVYKYLNKSWRSNNCHGPVGLCIGVETAYCEKDDKGNGVCRGNWAERASEEPIFMSAPKATEKE